MGTLIKYLVCIILLFSFVFPFWPGERTILLLLGFGIALMQLGCTKKRRLDPVCSPPPKIMDPIAMSPLAGGYGGSSPLCAPPPEEG